MPTPSTSSNTTLKTFCNILSMSIPKHWLSRASLSESTNNLMPINQFQTTPQYDKKVLEHQQCFVIKYRRKIDIMVITRSSYMRERNMLQNQPSLRPSDIETLIMTLFGHPAVLRLSHLHRLLKSIVGSFGGGEANRTSRRTNVCTTSLSRLRIGSVRKDNRCENAGPRAA